MNLNLHEPAKDLKGDLCVITEDGSVFALISCSFYNFHKEAAPTNLFFCMVPTIRAMAWCTNVF